MFISTEVPYVDENDADILDFIDDAYEKGERISSHFLLGLHSSKECVTLHELRQEIGRSDECTIGR